MSLRNTPEYRTYEKALIAYEKTSEYKAWVSSWNSSKYEYDSTKKLWKACEAMQLTPEYKAQVEAYKVYMRMFFKTMER